MKVSVLIRGNNLTHEDIRAHATAGSDGKPLDVEPPFINFVTKSFTFEVDDSDPKDRPVSYVQVVIE